MTLACLEDTQWGDNCQLNIGKRRNDVTFQFP